MIATSPHHNPLTAYKFGRMNGGKHHLLVSPATSLDPAPGSKYGRIIPSEFVALCGRNIYDGGSIVSMPHDVWADFPQLVCAKCLGASSASPPS